MLSTLEKHPIQIHTMTYTCMYICYLFMLYMLFAGREVRIEKNWARGLAYKGPRLEASKILYFRNWCRFKMSLFRFPIRLKFWYESSFCKVCSFRRVAHEYRLQKDGKQCILQMKILTVQSKRLKRLRKIHYKKMWRKISQKGSCKFSLFMRNIFAHYSCK